MDATEAERRGGRFKSFSNGVGEGTQAGRQTSAMLMEQPWRAGVRASLTAVGALGRRGHARGSRWENVSANGHRASGVVQALLPSFPSFQSHPIRALCEDSESTGCVTLRCSVHLEGTAGSERLS